MTDKELRALCEAATPGPWTTQLDVFDVAEGYEYTVDAAPDLDGPLIRVGTSAHPPDDDRARGSQGYRDAAFIAAARTEVPRLLDENAALRKLLWDLGGDSLHSDCERDCRSVLSGRDDYCDCGAVKLNARIDAALAGEGETR